MNNSNMDNTWLSAQETAKQVGRDARTVRRWCAPGGQLDGIARQSETGQWLIPASWVAEWEARSPMVDKGITADYTKELQEELANLQRTVDDIRHTVQHTERALLLLAGETRSWRHAVDEYLQNMRESTCVPARKNVKWGWWKKLGGR